MLTPLSSAEIRKQIDTTLGSRWKEETVGPDGNALFREYQFRNFPAAIAFMSACVEEVEKMNHHPIWENTYNRVKVTLTTWDARNRVTKLDVQLAELLDRFAQAHGDKDPP